MQKDCRTAYVVIGNEIDIKFMYKALLQLVRNKKTNLQYVASIFCPQWINYTSSGHFCELAKSNSRQIVFTVITGKEPEPDIWAEICRKYQSTKYYYCSELVQSGHYRTNDQSGRYFPRIIE